MATSPEVKAAIIKVAGDWALGMTSLPNHGEPPEPSQMSSELQTNFEFAFNYLQEFLSSAWAG